jgi:hypothetical protein
MTENNIRVVGQCYIDGIMNGDALKERFCGNMEEEDTLIRQSFM